MFEHEEKHHWTRLAGESSRGKVQKKGVTCTKSVRTTCSVLALGQSMIQQQREERKERRRMERMRGEKKKDNRKRERGEGERRWK